MIIVMDTFLNLLLVLYLCFKLMLRSTTSTCLEHPRNISGVLHDILEYLIS